MAKGLEYINRGKCNLMDNEIEHTEEAQHTSYRRASDQWVAFQLFATFVTVVAGVLSVQWQVGNLVSNITYQLTKADLQIQELKSDVAEIKARLK